MEVTARDIMVTNFETISPEASVLEAVRKIFNSKTRVSGYKTVSLMVVDDIGQLVGTISMFDLMYHLRPPFFNYGPENPDLTMEELPHYIERFKDLTVERVMSSVVETARPDEHLLSLTDRMVKKKYRRLPVVKDLKLEGVVYFAEVFLHLSKNWLDADK